MPLFVGLSATLALGALLFMIRSRGGAQGLAGALPKALGRFAGPKAKGPRNRPRREAAGTTLSLRPVQGGAPIRLDESGRALTVGRGPGADVVVQSDTISKVHARLAYDKRSQRVRVTDLNSSNGTYLNGARITEADAASGSLLRFGTVEYTLALDIGHHPQQIDRAAGSGWMLSGFDPSGRALQFELRPSTDPGSGREQPATWTFGRDPGRANFVIDDSSVSSLHAQLMYDPGQALMLRDMGSMNGTRLDGESIGKRTMTLRDTGHEIAFGLATLRLSRLTG
jgi:pSer/pThr/pTyr-binding forkhead associated (FHA) protein